MAIYSYQYGEDIAAYEQAGAERAYVAPGNQICWMDTSPELGFMVEIMSANPVFDGFFAKMKAAAENWDGRVPIRELVWLEPRLEEVRVGKNGVSTGNYRWKQ